MTLGLHEMIAARDAMESWIDACSGIEPEDVIEKVQRTVDVFTLVINEEMTKPTIPPVLRLVVKETEENGNP